MICQKAIYLQSKTLKDEEHPRGYKKLSLETDEDTKRVRLWESEEVDVLPLDGILYQGHYIDFEGRSANSIDLFDRLRDLMIDYTVCG